MKLYHTTRAPNPQRVEMFLAEKGVTDIDIVEISLMKGEHRLPEYKAKSPLSHVPALELDDGLVLTESRAICTFLEGTYPEPNLMGITPTEKAVIEMWDRRIELGLMLSVANWFRHTHPALAALEGEQVARWGEIAKGRAEGFARWLDKQLAGKDYVAADRFTIADITLHCTFEFGRLMKFRPWQELPNIAAWRERVAARPSAVAMAA